MMNEPQITYERLPGRGRRSGVFQAINSSCTLWLAPDHLLSVEGAGYQEKYHRYYLKDIQTIQLIRTDRHIVNNLVAVLLIIIITPILLSFGGAGVIIGFGWALGWLIAIAVNVSRGPGCRAWIRTAVQTDELPALARMRTAREVLERIRPLIEAAQGGSVPPEAAQARLAEYQRRALQAAFAPAAAAAQAPGPAAPPAPAFAPSPDNTSRGESAP